VRVDALSPTTPGPPLERRPGGQLRGSPSRRLRGACHHHGRVIIEHPQADLLDLVPDHRGPLELQLPGGVPHLRFQLRDHPFDLFLRHLRQIASGLS